MDTGGPKKKPSPVIKKPPQHNSNKIFPKLADEPSKTPNHQNYFGNETKKEAEESITPDKEDSKIKTELKESIMEQTAELEAVNIKNQDKTAPEQNEKSEEKLPIEGKQTSSKNKLANLKFRLNDIKRNEGNGAKNSNYSGSVPKEIGEKEMAFGRIHPFDHKFQNQGSLQFRTRHDSSEKNLMQEPLSADGRHPHLSLANSRDDSGKKEISEATFLGRSGISKMVGNMITRKSKIS